MVLLVLKHLLVFIQNKVNLKNKIMTKEELIQLLKENLKIDIWSEYDDEHGLQKINVGLYLGNEKISTSCSYL